MNLDKLPVIDWEAIWIPIRKRLYDPKTYKTATFIVFGVLLGWCLLSNLPVWGGTPAPTITATATPFESTHIPTRTLTSTWTKSPTNTYTSTAKNTVAHTATSTLTLTLTRTVTPTLSPSATPSHIPTLTPSATRIPAGRDTLPRTGMSEQEISELTPTTTATVEPTPTPLTLPDGCKFHSLLLESDKDYTELTFRCPNGEKAAESVGD
jgi:hypothetical protein